MSYNTELQSNNADLQEILDAVNALPDATELPELTNPGTAEDLEADKQLIDAEGNIVTGTVRVAHGGIAQEADSIDRIPMGDQSRIKLTVHVEEKTIIDPSSGNVISLTAPCSEFGDAMAEDVALGKTFTSAAGLKVAGTHIPLDTSDATATSEQMAEGATAYVNGEKVTGTIHDNGTYATSYNIGELSSFAGGTVIRLSGTKSTDEIVRAGSKIEGIISAQKFGDAAAADVTKGKTFTSAAGLKAVGTKEESGGIETVQVTVGVFDWNGSVWYTDASYSFQSLHVSGSATYEITCLKNSPVIFSGYGFAPSIEAAYEIPYEEDMSGNGMYVYHFTEDCNILIEAPGGGIEEPED